MRKFLLTLPLFAAALIHAQNRFPPINLYGGDPTGTACTMNSPLLQSQTTGYLYACDPNTSQYQYVAPDGGGSGSTPSHTQTALLAVRQGTANMHVWAYGDSTVFGFDSNYASSTDCTTYGWPRLLANDLVTYYGVPTLADSFFGAGLNGFSNYGICDPQVTLGTGWAQDYTYVLPGGGTFKATTGTSGTLHFVSLGQTDTLKIYYLTGSGFGTINGSIDGGSVTTQSAAGSLGLASMTLTASSGVGTHYADIAAPTGGNIYIWGEEWSNSVTPSVIVDQVGWPGASSVNLANKSSVLSPGYTLPYQTVGCDLGIFEAGAINDWQAGTTIPNFTTNVETTFGAMKAAGCDVALLTPVPSSTSVTAQATQQTYVVAMNAVSAAESNNSQTGPLPVVHVFESIGNYLAGAAWYGSAGLYNGTIHPNNLGYQFNASKIESALFPFPNADEGQNQAPFTGMQTPCYTRNVNASTPTTVSDCTILLSGTGITLTLSVVPTATRYNLVNYGNSAITLSGASTGNLPPTLAPHQSIWVIAGNTAGTWFLLTPPPNITTWRNVTTSTSTTQSDQVLLVTGAGITVTMGSVYAGTEQVITNYNGSNTVTLAGITAGTASTLSPIPAGCSYDMINTGTTTWFVLKTYCPASGGGDTITSPNSTLTVGGTTTNTTLDLNFSGYSGIGGFTNAAHWIMPTHGSFVPTNAGEIGYDTTNGNYWGYTNAAKIFPVLTNSGWTTGDCVSMSYLSSRYTLTDAGGPCVLLSASNTWTAQQLFPASTTGAAPINLGQGTAPTSPNNGDIWITSGGLYARYGGATVGPFGTGGGGMVYPGAGIGNSTGSAWGTSYSAGNTIPANFISTLNQNTTGTAANLSGTPALPNGTSATTQTTGDNTTDLATDAFVNASITANAYSLPQATTSVLGGVKVGAGLSASSGVLSATNYVADVTFSTGTTAVAANSCSPTVGGGGTSVTMTGLTSSMALSISASSDTSNVTGWGAPAGTVLYLVAIPGSGAFTYYVCNNSSSSVTPGGSVTWNVSAR